ADVDREGVTFLRHQANAVSQRAIAILQDAPQIFENNFGTDEDPRIDRVVGIELLADRDDSIAVRANFHLILEVENRRDLSVDGENENGRLGSSEQHVQDRLLKKMVAYREEKRCPNFSSRGEQRNAVLFLPVRIRNWMKLHPSRE